jgi:choice-of-anchor B domain-containing protein
MWREIRGYEHYMIIGSEARDHGIQIFDMRKLLHLSPAHPKTFSNDEDLTGLFTDLPAGRTHNVVINEETGFAYAVGALPSNNDCASGLIFIDLKDPSNPISPGCDPQDGYVHDAQCLIYRGPHKSYRGREICYAYDVDQLTIFDVTDKKSSKVLSRTKYKDSEKSFTHQGQVTNRNWQNYLLLDDEMDEEFKVGMAKNQRPVTYIFDISDLTAPKLTGHWKATRKGIDHNQYVWGNRTYQSNYGLGLNVIDISSIPEDPTGGSVKKLGHFDIYPEDDHLPGGGIADYYGSWSSYAGFESGYIFINSIERGGYVVKMTA